MAERRLAERPAMQLVGLDEDATDESSPVRSAPERLHDVAAGARTYAARRPAVAVVWTVAVVALLACSVFAVPRWLSTRERAQVLRPAAFLGAVHSLRSPSQERWRADVDGAATPLLVGDVVVVVAGSADAGDRRLVGLDAVTGGARWTVPLGADPVPTAVSCQSTGPLVTCIASPVPSPDSRDLPQVPDGDVAAGALWAVDPTDGAVRAHYKVAGWVMSTAAAASDLVVAAYDGGELSIRRMEPLTGRQVWVTERFATVGSSVDDRVRLVVASGLVMATGDDSTLLLDAATGQRRPKTTGTLGVDETRLDPDGTVVRQHYRIARSAIIARLQLADGAGDPWLTAEGSLLSKDVSDRASDLTFTSDGLGVDGIRAYGPGVDRQVWQSSTIATRVSVDVAGRVVVRNGGTLAGLDPTDGAVAWVRDLGSISGPAMSDGRRVAVLSGGLDDRAVLVVLNLADGGVVWQLPLPTGTSRVIRLGTQLYAVGDDVLAALR